MARVGITKRDVMNFNGGELSPLLYGRTDLDIWPRGCRQLQNMIPRKYGNAERRVGTQFIAAAKYADKKARLIEMGKSVKESFIIEVGDYYMRFYLDGARIETSGSPVEVASPYSEADIMELQYTAINDVVYFTHPIYPPYKLSHYSDTNWTMEKVEFDEPVFMDMNATATTITPSATIGSVTLTASSSIFNANHVGAYFKLGQKRAASNVSINLTANATSSALLLKGSFSVRTSGTWAGTLEVQRYNTTLATWETIYTHISDQDRNIEASYTQDDEAAQWRLFFTFISKDSTTPKAYLESSENYVYGWAKITAVTSGTVATATVAEPFYSTASTDLWYEGAWSPYRGYPSACAFFQQRMVYACTSHQPQTIWGSVLNDYQNFEYGTDDDMSYQYTIGSQERLFTKWLCVHNNALIIGTSSSDWAMSGSQGGDDPVTPTNIIIRRQTTTGDAPLRPIAVGNSILHVQRNAEKLYEMNYSISSYGYDDSDITQFAEHITEGGIVDIAYQRQPDGIIWSVRADGVLLSCVYDQVQKVVAWSSNPTLGSFESVAAAYNEDNGDEVWVLASRTLGDGSQVKYIERLVFSRFSSKEDCKFVDSYVSAGFDYKSVSTPVTSVGYIDEDGNLRLMNLDCSVRTFPEGNFGGVTGACYDSVNKITYLLSSGHLFKIENEIISDVAHDFGETGFSNCIYNDTYIIIADSYGRIVKYTPSTDTEDVLATGCGSVYGLCIIGSYVYFTDGYGDAGTASVYKVPLAGGSVSTVCSSTRSQIYKPQSLVSDGTYLYLCNLGNGDPSLPKIVKVDVLLGTASNLISGATSFGISYLYYVEEALVLISVSEDKVYCYATDGSVISNESITSPSFAVLNERINRLASISKFYEFYTEGSVELVDSPSSVFFMFEYAMSTSGTGSTKWLINVEADSTLHDGDVVRMAGTGYQVLDFNTFAINVISPTMFYLLDIAYAGDTSGVYPDEAYVENAFGASVTVGTFRRSVKTVSGLSHLEGLSVTGVGDGNVLPSMTVSGGSVTLDSYYSTVTLGLAYTSIIEPLAVQMSNETGSALSQTARIRGVDVRLKDTLGLKVTTDTLQYHEIVDVGVEANGGDIVYTEAVFRDTSDQISESPDLFTGILEVPLEQHHSKEPRVILKQDAPMPFNVLGMTFKYEITEPSSGKAQQ